MSPMPQSRGVRRELIMLYLIGGGEGQMVCVYVLVFLGEIP